MNEGEWVGDNPTHFIITKGVFSMKWRKLRTLVVCFVLCIGVVVSSIDAAAVEVRGITSDILQKVFEEYGSDVEVRPTESVAVYVNPYSNEVFYEVPVYKDGIAIGSFSVAQEGFLRKINQSIHLVDFKKILKSDEFIGTIEEREESEVKEWRYVFMRDLYTSAIVYKLGNGNEGVYVLTSKILKCDVCLSIKDWQYQVEYSVNVPWEEEDLQFINSEIEDWQAVVVLVCILLIILIIVAIIEGLLNNASKDKEDSGKISSSEHSKSARK